MYMETAVGKLKVKEVALVKVRWDDSTHLAVNLGTCGIAGHGYGLCNCPPEDFFCPVMIRGGKLCFWIPDDCDMQCGNCSGCEVTEILKIVWRDPEWAPRRKCGCI